MKISVSKMDAARSQLEEAILLFFEERDPVSIHTLVGASLQLLNDHINKGKVWDNNLLLHDETIYIKDKYRKFWHDKLNEAKNFFKHADRDLEKGITTIEFETDLNEVFIFEAIRSLNVVDKTGFRQSVEIIAFWSWFCLKNKHILKQDYIDTLAKIPYAENVSGMPLNYWREVIRIRKENK